METISYLIERLNEETKRRFKEKHGYIPTDLCELEYKFLDNNIWEITGYDIDNYPNKTSRKYYTEDCINWKFLEMEDK